MIEGERREQAGGDCDRVRERAGWAILARPEAALAGADAVHLADCPDCRAEVERMTRLDAVLAEALEASREATPLPAAAAVERVLEEAREEAPEALFLRRFRRSVRRMLWLTILVLSFLLVAAIGLALLDLLGRLHGG